MSKKGSSSSQQSSQQKEFNIATVVEVEGSVLSCNNTNSTNFVRSKYPEVKLMNPKIPIDVSKFNSHRQALLLDINRENVYSIKKMYSLDHQNVLGCEYIQEADERFCRNFNDNKDFTKDKDTTYNIVAIEEINGTLEGFIVKSFYQLLIEDIYMPSPKCTQLVLSIINALRFLHGIQTYHGNFSAQSTLFSYKHGKIVVKLANFIEKTDGLEHVEHQVQDWVDFAHFLKRIRGDCQHWVFVDHLNRAIDFFENININQITHMDEELRRLDFFWTCEDRWLYARGLFSWCDKHSAYLKTHLTSHIQMPWDNFTNFYGKSVVTAMNNFKDKDGKKGSQSDYKTDDVISLLKFVSGVYSHYNTLGVNELSGGLKYADAFICMEFPSLFFHLREMANVIGVPVI